MPKRSRKCFFLKIFKNTHQILRSKATQNWYLTHDFLYKCAFYNDKMNTYFAKIAHVTKIRWRLKFQDGALILTNSKKWPHVALINAISEGNMRPFFVKLSLKVPHLEIFNTASQVKNWQFSQNVTVLLNVTCDK